MNDALGSPLVGFTSSEVASRTSKTASAKEHSTQLIAAATSCGPGADPAGTWITSDQTHPTSVSSVPTSSLSSVKSWSPLISKKKSADWPSQNGAVNVAVKLC